MMLQPRGGSHTPGTHTHTHVWRWRRCFGGQRRLSKRTHTVPRQVAAVLVAVGKIL